jgi:hypothetical protein
MKKLRDRKMGEGERGRWFSEAWKSTRGVSGAGPQGKGRSEGRKWFLKYSEM